jgi:chromosome segregation ATPase
MSDRNDLICSIARSEEQIRAVEAWRDTEYKAKYEELSKLQADLDGEIAREEEYRRHISSKLDQIAHLKAKVNESVPDDNGFTITAGRRPR